MAALRWMVLQQMLILSAGYDLDSTLAVPRWSLLRIVERSLQGTAGVVRGVGDAIAVGTGGTIRMIGGSMQQVGGGIEGLSDAIEGGDRARIDNEGAHAAGSDSSNGSGKDLGDALRSVASRPIRVVGRVMRSLGDTTNFIGETTEKVAAETIGILPDTVRVVESSVRTLREKIGDSDDDLDEDLHGRGAQMGTRHQLLEEGRHGGGDDGGGGSGGGGTRQSLFKPLAHGDGSSPVETKGGGAPAAAAARADDGRRLAGGSARGGGFLSARLRAAKALGGWYSSPLEPSSELQTRGLQSHAFFALVTVAVAARSMSSRFGVALLVMLALLYLGYVDAAQREAMAREAAAVERRASYLNSPEADLQALIPEPAGWANAVLSSGWGSALGRYVTATAREAIDASLTELDASLPKSLKAIRLQDLQLGAHPPVVRSVAAVGTPGPAPRSRDGCALQAEIEWEAPYASATLAFRMANVASQPRLRLRRARLRGTIRLHWEWIDEHPWVGRVRATFVRRPEVGDFAIEPLGTIDVTALPGIGQWLRESMRDCIFSYATMPHWVECDLRTSTAQFAEALRQVITREVVSKLGAAPAPAQPAAPAPSAQPIDRCVPAWPASAASFHKLEPTSSTAPPALSHVLRSPTPRPTGSDLPAAQSKVRARRARTLTPVLDVAPSLVSPCPPPRLRPGTPRVEGGRAVVGDGATARTSGGGRRAARHAGRVRRGVAVR